MNTTMILLHDAVADGTVYRCVRRCIYGGDCWLQRRR